MELRSLVAQARGREPVAPLLTDAALTALDEGSRQLAELAAGGEVYGLSTGVGALRDVAVDADGGVPLRLWRSHAARFGPELDDADARAVLLARLAQLAAGPSGVSPALAVALEGAVVAGAVPVLHEYGAVGTADLSVLAELALALVGEGPWRGAAPPPAVPAVSDALPFLSSNAATVGTGALVHADLVGVLAAAERVAALSCLALRGAREAYDPRVFDERRDPEAAAVAARLTALLDAASERGARLQDPFALRTLPQVHGVATAALGGLEAALRAELDHPRENPLPLPGAALHHGQFLTQRLAAALDATREALVGVVTLSQARLAALVDPRLSGLAAFLADGPPGSSGVMILEYVAADLAARVRGVALATTLTRTTLSLGLEETASHATQGVHAARAVAGLLPDLLACELLAAARALRLDPARVPDGGPAADLAHCALAALGDVPLADHPLGDELRAAADLVRDWAADPAVSRSAPPRGR
ncbi:aromatic amino acid lyase [Nocardioides anomalus]|uniref:Aromatic amino acid lyase n=1 Tax=Nocardioides anomalus TaxID=2712223 RepID=A0A6G6WCY0_9ACTN|nr:aromatic amino acid lyase [Nocardioides anomalus]QIG42955.1 aromatic amino acid lyase [Nocardioides anomalus]